MFSYKSDQSEPVEEESFPQLRIAPDVDGCRGPLLEFRGEGKMNIGTMLLYRACVKMLKEKRMNGRMGTPWRSALGFNTDFKPE